MRADPDTTPPVMFERHWKAKGTKALCRALGIKKITDKPARDKVRNMWSSDSYEPRVGMFLPVEVPLSVDPWEHDKIAIPVAFLKNTLAPACRENGCC